MADDHDADVTVRLTSQLDSNSKFKVSSHNHETQPKKHLFKLSRFFTPPAKDMRYPENINSIEMQNFSGNAEVGAGTKSLNFKLLLSRFMDFTTSHGITHIYNAKGLMKKCFWGILTMISTVLLCLHLWSLITGYLSYDTVTNVSLREARSLVFPAVTICNNNGVQSSNMPSWMDDLVQTKFQKILNSTSESHSKNDLATAISEETSLLNDTAKMSLGYSFKDLVLICIFDGKNCDETEFWTYYHSTYGNCYTFNTGKYGPVKRSTMPGPSHGLTLVVNTGVYEYIKFLTEEAGIKVVVHDQRAMPFPNHDGLSTSPGQVNNIAVKMINTTRLDGDYGNCTRLDSNKDNMYFYPYNVSYTQWACLKTCYQKELVTQCKCFDPNMPYNSEGIVFIDLDKAQGPCRLTNSTTVNCVNRVHSRFADGTLKCSNCYQPCNEVTYDAALSTSDFPALSYVDSFVTVINRSHPELIKRLEEEYGDDQITFAIQSNFLKINVFHQQMTYTTYEQVPSYDAYQFASDFGGAWGLWIGWSILTIFELIEFGVELILYSCFSSSRQRKRKDNS